MSSDDDNWSGQFCPSGTQVCLYLFCNRVSINDDRGPIINQFANDICTYVRRYCPRGLHLVTSHEIGLGVRAKLIIDSGLIGNFHFFSLQVCGLTRFWINWMTFKFGARCCNNSHLTRVTSRSKNHRWEIIIWKVLRLGSKCFSTGKWHLYMLTERLLLFSIVYFSTRRLGYTKTF